MPLLNQPKYGGSDSRPIVVQSSEARMKFGSLNVVQTDHLKKSSVPLILTSRFPRMKKCLPSSTHWSELSSTRERRSSMESWAAAAGISEMKQVGLSSCHTPHVRHVYPMAH